MLELTPWFRGPKAGSPLVFIQGWPDDHRLWDATVPALEDKYRCILVDLPNYGDAPKARFGYGTAEIADALARAIRAQAPGGKVTIVAHDWGAYWGAQMHHTHPELVWRFAGVDIAPHTHLTVKSALGMFSYQSYLFLALLLGTPIGDWMTRAFAKWAGAPGAPETIRASLNYPYLHIWADLLSGRAALQGYWPKVPLFFAYGADKPYPFHSEGWLSHVRRQEGGRVVEFPCNHWVPVHPNFGPTLRAWLNETDHLGPSLGETSPHYR